VETLEKEKEAKKAKDYWDKVDIVLRPINGLLTALAVALLGYYTSSIVRQSELKETNERVYTELMSSREQAESGLRKDMFTSIIQTFLRPEKEGLEGKMLNLEMLAYNFHESLNLKPLFDHMDRQIADLSDFNPQQHELVVELGVRTPKESSALQLRQFHVGYYDFPMIDNTRLSHDQRAAVVMTQSSDVGAELTLVYFPGSYASLKEKVSYDEVVEKLREMGQRR
jgi:hypothetical protein